MGCENSQMVEVVPHQPHQMPQEEQGERKQEEHKDKRQQDPQQKEQLQSVSPPPKLQPPQKDKENTLPQEPVGKVKRESRKLEAPKEGADVRMKPRSECKLEAAGGDGAGGNARENLVLEETRRGNEKRESKRLSSRKIAPEEPAFGPSSRSIESVEKKEATACLKEKITEDLKSGRGKVE